MGGALARGRPAPLADLRNRARGDGLRSRAARNPPARTPAAASPRGAAEDQAMIVARKHKDGSIRGYEVRAYDPRTQKMRYVGLRAKLKGEGGAKELERIKEQEYALLAAEGATDDRCPARICRDLADRWIED